MPRHSEFYLVTEPGMTPFRKWQWVSEQEVDEIADRFGLSSFAVRPAVDIVDEWLSQPTLDPGNLQFLFRMIIVAALLNAPHPHGFFRNCGKSALADETMSNLYAQAVMRIQRLGRLRDADAPEIVRRNERRLIRMTACALIAATSAANGPPTVATAV